VSFPSTRLENFTEILIDGVWTDITSSVRAASGIAISRGIRDESSNRAGAGSMGLTLDNRNGTYSDLNPASTYYGKIGRNTKIRHSRRHAYDAFGRTAANGWGTADSGQAWSTNGGVAGDYSVSSGTGRISNGSVNVVRETVLAAGVGGTTLLDGTVSATLKPGVVATGADIQMALEMRRADASNYLFAIADFDTAGTVDVIIAARVAGVNTVLATSSDRLSYGASDAFRMEFTVTGGQRTVRLWNTASPNTQIWTYADDSTTASAAITAAGNVACRSILITGNTNTTPVVTFDDLVVQDIRFSGEVPEWPQRWDVSGRNVYVPLTAAGLLRRLTQGTRRLQSVMTRASLSAGPIDFWPCEDSSGAAQATDAVQGGQPLMSNGATPSFGTEMVPGAAGGFTLGTDTGFRTVVQPSTSTVLSVQFLINIPAAPASASRIISLEMSSGTYWLIVLTLFPAGGVDTWGLEIFDGGGVRQVFTSVAFSINTVDEPYGRDLYVMLDMRQNGGNVEYEFRAYDYTQPAASGSTGSYAGTLGKIGQLVICNPGQVGPGSGVKYSQIGVFPVSTTFASWVGAGSYDATGYINGFTGEDPVARLQRLAAENGIDLVTQGNSSTRGVGMGAQGQDTLYNLLLECADVDQGLLYETRTQFGLTYRAAASLYNQTAVALNYTGRQLAPDIQPTSDDQYIRNDVTVARKSGSSSRIVDMTSRLSVNEPPSGVGQYDRGTTTVNCELDADTRLIAGWLAKLGTVDEPRYPSLAVQMASPAVAGSSSLTQGLAGLDTGDTFSVSNPPAWLPQFDILQLVLGYQEQMGMFDWTLRYTGRPGKPFDIGIVDGSGNTARVDTGNQTLSTSATSSGTSFSVATSTGPLLRTGSGLSIDLDVAGEKVTATNISGAASPQTVTVTRSVNGVVKAQASGAVVRLWRPSRIGY
jgi:hypothetical protein